MADFEFTKWDDLPFLRNRENVLISHGEFFSFTTARLKLRKLNEPQNPYDGSCIRSNTKMT